jgi:hypothetical protein
LPEGQGRDPTIARRLGLGIRLRPKVGNVPAVVALWSEIAGQDLAGLVTPRALCDEWTCCNPYHFSYEILRPHDVHPRLESSFGREGPLEFLSDFTLDEALSMFGAELGEDRIRQFYSQPRE